MFSWILQAPLIVSPLFIARSVVGACPHPTWLAGYNCTVNGTCTCKDNLGFIDPYGYDCSDYNANCLGLVAAWAYEQYVVDLIIANCPLTCAICSCGQWQSCFAQNSSIVQDTEKFRALRGGNNSHVIRAGAGTWFSVDLVRALFKMFLIELLGYAVTEVDSRAHSLNDMDYLLEVWVQHQGSISALPKHVEEFDMGYNGKEGFYFTGVRYQTCQPPGSNCSQICSQQHVDAGQCANESDAFEYYASHRAPRARRIFPNVSALKNFSTGSMVQKTTPYCQQSGVSCMGLLHWCTDSECNNAPFLAVMNKIEFPYHVLIPGVAKVRQIVRAWEAVGRGVVFTYWEPDPFMIHVKAKSIAIPFHDSKCHDMANGYGVAIGCDRAETLIKNRVNTSLRWQAPEIYYALRGSFRISKDHIGEMMAVHSLGGGSIDTLNATACAWMQQNINIVRSWLPLQCAVGTKPYILADLSLGCCNGTLLQLTSGAPYTCIPICNLAVEVPDAVNGVCLNRCAAGSVRNQTNSTCIPCQHGAAWEQVSDPYYTGVVAECRPCRPGSVQPLPNQLQCNLCPRGFFSQGTVNSTPSLVCEACQPGQFQDRGGMSSCLSCPPGFHAPAAATPTCSRCQAGRFSSAGGQATCTPCVGAWKTTEFLGSMSPSNCVCQAGYFMDAISGGTSCKPCYEGMACAVGSIVNSTTFQGSLNGTFPQLKAWYWSSVDEPLSVFLCEDEHHCKGGFPGSCPVQLRGRSCARCVDEWYWAANACKKCLDIDLTAVTHSVGPSVLICAVVFAMYKSFGDPVDRWGSWRNTVVAIAFVTLQHYQALTYLGAIQVAVKPSILDSTMQLWSWTVDLFSALRVECTPYGSFNELLLVQCLGPLGLLAFCVACLVTSHGLAIALNKPMCAMDANRLSNVYMSLLFTFSSAITNLSLKLFKCSANPNRRFSLTADRSILCYSRGDWNKSVSVAVTACAFYVVGFTVIVMWAIFTVTFSTRFLDPAFRMRWKFLFIKFRPDVHWWALALLAKNLMYNLGFVVSTVPVWQVFWMLGVTMTYGATVVWFLPYRSRWANTVDICACASITFVSSILSWFAGQAPSYTSEYNDTMGVLGSIISFVPLAMGTLVSLYIIARGQFQKGEESELYLDVGCKWRDQLKSFVELDDVAGAVFLARISEWDRWFLKKSAAMLAAELMGERGRRGNHRAVSGISRISRVFAASQSFNASTSSIAGFTSRTYLEKSENSSGAQFDLAEPSYPPLDNVAYPSLDNVDNVDCESVPDASPPLIVQDESFIQGLLVTPREVERPSTRSIAALAQPLTSVRPSPRMAEQTSLRTPIGTPRSPWGASNVAPERRQLTPGNGTTPRTPQSDELLRL